MKIDKTIVSSLADIDSVESKNKLWEYALSIKNGILKQNNDERLDSLTLLEKFAFRVPKEALEIIKVISDHKNEKLPQKYYKPFSRLGYKHSYILEKCLDILNQYGVRYGELHECFNILTGLYCYKVEKEEYASIRKKAGEILQDIANYNLKIIRPENIGFLGYRCQESVFKEIKFILKSNDKRLFNLGISLVRKLLETEAEGSYWDHKTVTFRRAPLAVNQQLSRLRRNLIDFIIERVKAEKDLDRKIKLVDSLESATHYPLEGLFDALELLIMADTKYLLKFYNKFDLKNSSPVLVQEIDSQLSWVIRRFKDYKWKNPKQAVELFNTAKKIKSKIRKDGFYSLYSFLVRNSRDDFMEEGGWSEAQEKVSKEIKRHIEEINHNNASQWVKIFKKIIATTRFKEPHEFSNLRFLFRQLGQKKPEVALAIIKLLSDDRPNTIAFIVDFLMGIKISGNSQSANAVIDHWLKSKKYEYIRNIPFIYSLKENETLGSFDLAVFEKLVNLPLPSGKRRELDRRTTEFLPWVFKGKEAKYYKFLLKIVNRMPPEDLVAFSSGIAMSDHRGHVNLDGLPLEILTPIVNKFIKRDRLDYHDDKLLSVYANKNLMGLIDFFKSRVKFKPRKKPFDVEFDRYDPIPYHLGDIAKAIKEHPGYPMAIEKIIKEWVMSEDTFLSYEGRHFIHRISPELDASLAKVLINYVKSGRDKAFAALRVLSEFEGSATIDTICLEAIKRYDDKEIRSIVFTALYSTGMVTGEYGLYNAHKTRIERVSKWNHGNNPLVKSFIKEFTDGLSKSMEEEKREVEDREELMKRGIDAFND